MKNSESAINNTFAFQLKGSLLTLTMLQLLQTDSDAFTKQLQELIKKTPKFFNNAPVIIDLEKLYDCYDIIDFGRIKSELYAHNMIPVGVRNGNDTQHQAAITAGMGVLSNSNAKPENPKAQTSSNKNSTSKLITQPVRSGQQVYAHNSDLIVLASVSPGAELLADGHIHVYGTLRGRALAGVSGDVSARIFCHKLEAELISIAGYYKLHDDIKIPKASHGIQIFLEEEKLSISAI